VYDSFVVVCLFGYADNTRVPSAKCQRGNAKIVPVKTPEFFNDLKKTAAQIVRWTQIRCARCAQQPWLA
jgi:hypothetical protein